MVEDDKKLGYYAVPAGIEHHYDIDFPLEEPEVFREFHSTLRQAGPNDTVYLHINSPGGRFDTMVQIIHSINTTEATVVGCAEGDVSSAAATIFFACHGYQLSEHAEFLLHNGQGGYIGKPSDQLDSAMANARRVKNVYKSVYGPFFSKKEIKDILQGKELYLDGIEVADRLTKAMQNKEEEQVEA